MSNKSNHSMSLAQPDTNAINTKQKIALALGLTGFFILILAAFNVDFQNHSLLLTIALLSISVGTILYANDLYLSKSKGIKNDGVWFTSISSRGVLGWMIGILLTLFYIVLYFKAELLGLGTNGKANTGLVALFDPLSLFVLMWQTAIQNILLIL
uniref:hypothetical protein n=1 Tax=Gelidibacter sp. TaxID=2018083 RepID=UPI00404B4970